MTHYVLRDVEMEYREIPIDSCEQEFKRMHFKIYVDKKLIWEGHASPEQMFLNFCLTCESAALPIQ